MSRSVGLSYLVCSFFILTFVVSRFTIKILFFPHSERVRFLFSQRIVAMSNKFRISHSQSVQLPNKCILCGAHPRTEYKISGSTLSGFSFYLLFTGVKYETMSIPTPVCLKHYYIILLMRILLAVSFIAMIFFGINAFKNQFR